MTTYDDTKVQLTINRMTQECYDSLSGVSTKELYLISENPTGVAKIDLDAQGAIESEISALSAQTIETFSQIDNDISALSAWDTTQDSLISELSTQTISNSTDISALSVEIQEVSANMSKSIIRRWEPVVGLKFVAEEANSTIAMQKAGSAPDVSLEYNTGDGWNDFIVGTTTVTLANVGDECFIRAKTTNTGMGSSASDYNQFVMTGKIVASDSIMYLLKNDGDLSVIPSSQCFNQLFDGCSSLTTAPTLPATTLASYCYQNLFNNCTSLTQAPELPATTLASSCYRAMFEGCTSLTSAPELPATTLDVGCYNYMFNVCASLATPPDLPATTLAEHCYDGMFYGCTSLTQAPELPATTLASSCYRSMFRGCSSLTQAPDLQATTLTEACYRQMFYGCSSLSEIRIAYTGNFSGQDVPTNAFNNWVNGVASTGTFYYDGEDTTTGNSAIPTGWTVEPLTPSQQGLKFTALQANSTVGIEAIGSAPTLSLVMSFGQPNDWTPYSVGDTITLANIGDSVWLKAASGGNERVCLNNSSRNHFVMSGSISCDGSIQYLMDENATIPSAALPERGFYDLFKDCSVLTTAPELPATGMSLGCYSGLFQGCSLLTKAPKLPATTLANYCYQGMFYRCSSLNEIEIAYTGNFSGTGVPVGAFGNWVYGVAASGTLYYNGSDTTISRDAIPRGWTVQTF